MFDNISTIVAHDEHTVILVLDKADSTRNVQLWRLSDLSLQRTIELPLGPHFEGYRSAEPRLLSDGKTVLVSTFNCGLFLLDGIASATPRARWGHGLYEETYQPLHVLQPAPHRAQL